MCYWSSAEARCPVSFLLNKNFATASGLCVVVDVPANTWRSVFVTRFKQILVIRLLQSSMSTRPLQSGVLEQGDVCLTQGGQIHWCTSDFSKVHCPCSFWVSFSSVLITSKRTKGDHPDACWSCPCLYDLRCTQFSYATTKYTKQDQL